MTQKDFDHYWKRMQTEGPALALTSPKEWDFRIGNLHEDEVYQAVDYEYARERMDVCAEAVAFLKTVVKGKSVQRYLFADELPSVAGLFAPMTRGKMIALDYPVFPMPWLAMQQKDRLALCSGPRNPSLVVLPMTPNAPAFGYWLTVLWDQRRTIDDMASEFKNWLRKEEKKHPRKLVGRGSQPPFHKLKQLTAHRLKKAGMGYERTREFVEERGGIFYSSEGAWHGACKAAKKELARQELKPM